MSYPSQANRAIALSSPLGDDVLLFLSMTGTEQLGRLPSYEVSVASNDAEIAFADIVGQRVTIRMELSDGDTRYINGFVSRFQYVGTGQDGISEYRMTLVPWLWLLTRTADCRIFQEMTAPDIILEVFRDKGFTDFENSLTGSYQPWPFCVQYRETAFNFVSRMMEQEGIYYHFRHEEGVDKLILCDDPSAHATHATAESLPYYPPSRGRQGGEYVSQWSVGQRVEPGQFALRDWDFKMPGVMITENNATDPGHAQGDFEVYDFPGEFVNSEGDQGNAADYVRIRMEERHAEQEIASGKSNCRGLACGHKFELSNFNERPDQNREYLVTAASYRITGGSIGTGRRARQEIKFSCSFQAIPAETPFRSDRITPKPVVQGPQTAIVTGPDGEEIHTDAYGRVKVRFHWDRNREDAPEDSSCWVRVSQNWAGKNWGAFFLPRIGQEVIVDFLEGDPDRPIITGRVYNEEQMPPYELPANKTRSTVKTRSSKEGTPDNFNEIRFEDKKGEEELFTHAEKDQNSVVENDETHTVGHDREKTVDNDETTQIGGNRTEQVEKDETISISGNRTESVSKDETISIDKNQTISIKAKRSKNVGKDEAISVGGSRASDIGKAEDLTIGTERSVTVGKGDTLGVGKKLAVTAGDEIVLKTGKASITMKKDGTITIKGKNIKIEGSGKIDVKASKAVTMKGSKINQN